MLGCSSYNGKYTRTPAQMDMLNDSVVALVDYNLRTDSMTSYCTGTFVSRYAILTANHCVEHVNLFDNVYVALHGEGIDYAEEYYSFYVSEVDEDNDLALLYRNWDGKDLPTHPWLKIAGQAPEQGENVIVIGHPDGLTWTLTTGVVSSDTRHGWDAPYEAYGHYRPLFIQHEASVYYGNSGGPLINYDNELAGVVVQKHPGNNNIAMSVHTSIVRQFLSGRRIL